MKYTTSAAIIGLFIAWSSLLADTVTVHGSMGMLEAPLLTKTFEEVGVVNIWNNTKDLNIEIHSGENYILSKVYVYIDKEPAPPPSVPTEPEFEDWPYQVKYNKVVETTYSLTLNFEEDLDFEWGKWGEPWLENRVLTIATRVELKSLDAKPTTLTAWAINTHPEASLVNQETGWGDNAYAMRYEVQHPMHGNFFLDGPVHGLGYGTRTQAGETSLEGGYWFFPEEMILFYIGDVEIGYAKSSNRMSPYDIFNSAENVAGSPAVNMARLLKSMDTNPEPHGSIHITGSIPYLELAMDEMGISTIDFMNSSLVEALIGKMIGYATTGGLLIEKASIDDAIAALENAAGSTLVRRNISKSPDYAVDKPKLDIMPVWVPARRADGGSTVVNYKDTDGNLISSRSKVKPLFVSYTEEQEPNFPAGITRRGSDIITAVSLDDGETWKRFNVSHMARKSSFVLTNGQKFPGDSRGPRQKIVDDKIMVIWTSAYARGGKPSFAIKTDDAYPHDDAYAVHDVWGVRGRQGSVNYDEDKDVGDQGFGEIPYYSLWSCRGVLVWEKNLSKYPGKQIGDIVWFKPERLTSGRRDAFFAMLGGARNVGFAVAWQEDPGGLLPGSCKGGGHGWSGATVHKKTDIWYSYLDIADFDLIDTNWDPDANHSGDEQSVDAPDEHGQQPEISNRPKWLVPMSLPVRVSDNAVVNTENLKVELNPDTGLPVVDPLTGSLIPLDGALEEDFLATEHEHEGGCDDTDGEDDDHSDHGGRGGGWGMARYAYEIPELGILDLSDDPDTRIWDEEVDGEYLPSSGMRWTQFINKPGVLKTVAVTADGRELDGNTGACRPSLQVQSGGWVLLGYEETKGLGIPPEGEHGEDTDVGRPEPDDKGKNVVYHSFKFDKPDMISAGNILNLPALDNAGNLIPIYYKDAYGESTDIFRQYKTEVARRVRFISQPKSKIGSSRTVMLATYRQGREGNGKPADVFVVRGVVPPGDTGNPYRFANLQRYGTGAETTDPNVMRYQRQHMNMSAATVVSMDPIERAGDGEGNTWKKVGKWKQYHGNITDESFANPYSDAKAHRGFIRGDTVVFGYSFTPNWGRLGGDHMDFFVRRSFNGGQAYTTDPNGPEEVTHTVIERDPDTGEFQQKQYQYGRGLYEPARNVSLLKGNKYTITDPRLVPPMKGGSTVNPTYPEDDAEVQGLYYVAFGTAEVLHGIGEPMGVETTEKEDIFYTRTTDGGSTWLMVPWEINPDSASPDAGETVYRWPWLAQGGTHQGHAQIRMHPSGNRFYAIWHQYSHGDELHLSPHDVGDDIWFRRIDFMAADE